jgi:hypothetical protein
VRAGAEAGDDRTQSDGAGRWRRATLHVPELYQDVRFARALPRGLEHVPRRHAERDHERRVDSQRDHERDASATIVDHVQDRTSVPFW